MVNDFAGDPYLVGIESKAVRHGVYESERSNRKFGLPLVTGWRSFPTSMESAYRVMVARLSPCFVSSTGYKTDSKGCQDETEAHIYPFEDLHVTVATFRSSLDPCPSNNERAEAIKKFCASVMENATKREGWPKAKAGDKSKIKLCLQPKEVRLGKKNAYILWEEKTGNLEAMRLCLKEEMEAQQFSQRGVNGVDPVADSDLAFFVPNIVHSTFIRFWKCPSNPDILKQTFKESGLLDILPILVDLDSNAKLVYETTPCMHINDDEYHVLWKEF